MVVHVTDVVAGGQGAHSPEPGLDPGVGARHLGPGPAVPVHDQRLLRVVFADRPRVARRQHGHAPEGVVVAGPTRVRRLLPADHATHGVTTAAAMAAAVMTETASGLVSLGFAVR